MKQPSEDLSLPQKIEKKEDIMLEKAIERGLDVSTIEKLIELREKLIKEQARQEFIRALSLFQSKIPEIPKDKSVLNKDGTVRYRYCSYDKIVSAIKPFLAECGLSYRYETSFADGKLTIHCIIQHQSGHSEKTSFTIPVDTSPHMTEIQRFGSTITYARRYALCLALGLATEEDTDAADLPAEESIQEQRPAEDEPITESQRKAILTAFSRMGIQDRERRLKICSEIIGKSIQSTNDLTKKEASRIIERLIERRTNEG